MRAWTLPALLCAAIGLGGCTVQPVIGYFPLPPGYYEALPPPPPPSPPTPWVAPAPPPAWVPPNEWRH